MALNTVGETGKSTPDLASDEQIKAVADKAIQIIENNPAIGEMIKESLKSNILDAILKNPMMVQSVLDEVDRRFKERFDALPVSERLKAIQGYANLTEQLGHDIAKKTLNMPLENALNDARDRFDKKTESLRNTYRALEESLKNELNKTAN